MRTIINKKQTQPTLAVYYNGRPIMFNKDTGYSFSDSSEMDECVNYFLSLDGFELVKDVIRVRGNPVKKVEPKKEIKPEPKKEIKKDSGSTKESIKQKFNKFKR